MFPDAMHPPARASRSPKYSNPSSGCRELHGLSLAAGMALASKEQQARSLSLGFTVFVDGNAKEGQCLEAFNFIENHNIP